MKKTYIQPIAQEKSVSLASMIATSITVGNPILDGESVVGDVKVRGEFEETEGWEEF